MEKYDSKSLEKAPRYVVAGAIYQEVVEGRGPILWRGEASQVAKSRAPVGQEYARRGQVEITLQFQRLLGGARINEKAETSVAGLFAAGESAGGVHGGDRMQSNGFLETQVFGANAGRNAAALAGSIERIDIKPNHVKEERARLACIRGDLEPDDFMQKVQKTMWEKVGIVRERSNLLEAVVKLEQLREEMSPRLSGNNRFATLEAANLALVGEMVARAALAREETRSAQIRKDYPLTDPNWVKHVCITKLADKINISELPVVTRYGREFGNQPAFEY